MNGKHEIVLVSSVPEDSFVQACVKVDMIGVYVEVGASSHIAGNWTVIEPPESIALPIVNDILIVEVVWTTSGLKLDEQLIREPGVYP